MSGRRLVALLLASAATQGLAGCEGAGDPLPIGWGTGAAWDVEAVAVLAPAGDPYADALQRGYVDLARIELADYDWRAGAEFTARAKAAAEGRPPEPRSAPPVEDMAEALEPLLGYLAAPGPRLRAGRQIGEAQVSWDCWVEEAREFETQDRTKLESCRERYTALIELIRDLAQLPGDIAVVLPGEGMAGGIELRQGGRAIALNRPWAAAATGTELADLPVAESEIQDAFGAALAARPKPPTKYEITFDFNSTRITDAAFEDVLRAATDVRSRAAAEVIITGHADAPGSSGANLAISRRRAEAVRQAVLNELRREESPVFSVVARGEGDTAVETPAVERRNRRVVVLVR
jgi:outer membrane protein OmpA-like peptidoglycan-associated protein